MNSQTSETGRGFLSRWGVQRRYKKTLVLESLIPSSFLCCTSISDHPETQPCAPARTRTSATGRREAAVAVTAPGGVAATAVVVEVAVTAPVVAVAVTAVVAAVAVTAPVAVTALVVEVAVTAPVVAVAVTALVAPAAMRSHKSSASSSSSSSRSSRSSSSPRRR